MKLSEKIQEALREQQEINLSDPAVQKRLAAQWGYVPADAQPAPNLPVDLITDYLVSISAHVAHQEEPQAQAEIGELLRMLAAAPKAKP